MDRQRCELCGKPINIYDSVEFSMDGLPYNFCSKECKIDWWWNTIKEV